MSILKLHYIGWLLLENVRLLLNLLSSYSFEQVVVCFGQLFLLLLFLSKFRSSKCEWWKRKRTISHHLINKIIDFCSSLLLLKNQTQSLTINSKQKIRSDKLAEKEFGFILIFASFFYAFAEVFAYASYATWLSF